jgi:hypothetical protein
MSLRGGGRVRCVLAFVYYCIPSGGSLYIFPFMYMYIFGPPVLS